MDNNLKIHQHHEPVDFKELLDIIENDATSMFGDELRYFVSEDSEIHSFIGSAEYKDRIKNALGIAVGSDEAVEILRRASSFVMIIIISDEAEHPLQMQELAFVNEFVTGLPKGCEIQWGISKDNALNDRVKVILLAQIK